MEKGLQSKYGQFSCFTIRRATSDWLRRGQNSHCIIGKCRQTHAAKYEITLEHISNDLKMWIKRFQTEIHNKITIYIHNRSIYFKIITCIILGLVCSSHFECLACETNSVFSDFVLFCVTGKRNRTGAPVLWNGRIPPQFFVIMHSRAIQQWRLLMGCSCGHSHSSAWGTSVTHHTLSSDWKHGGFYFTYAICQMPNHNFTLCFVKKVYCIRFDLPFIIHLPFWGQLLRQLAWRHPLDLIHLHYWDLPGFPLNAMNI